MVILKEDNPDSQLLTEFSLKKFYFHEQASDAKNKKKSVCLEKRITKFNERNTL